MVTKEEYEKLRKERGLPSYEEINGEFEIGSIELKKINSLPNAILRIICNKMGSFLSYVEPVIGPSPQGLHAFIEVENTTNDEKKEIFSFYKNLSHKYHKAYSLELIESEDMVVEEIKSIWNNWDKIKKDFRKVSKMINSSWERERKKETIETIG